MGARAAFDRRRLGRPSIKDDQGASRRLDFDTKNHRPAVRKDDAHENRVVRLDGNVQAETPIPVRVQDLAGCLDP
jgi:hypothetical protein